MKLKDAYLKTTEILKNEGIDSYLSDARFLVSSFLNKDYSYIILNPDEEFDFDKFEILLKRRILGEPCQYIVGETQFMGLTFKVDKRVLVPRQDTEVLIEEIVNNEKDFSGDILDICTGSGCIGVSLKKFLKSSKVDALDISEDALCLAKENAGLNGVEVNFFKEDILEKTTFSKQYDIIVSNPPYIKSSVVLDLMPTVKDYEPKIALDGGKDGLLFYKKIISLLKSGLKKGGRVYFEIGFDQGEAVKALLEQNGFYKVEIIKDYSSNDRVVKGKML